MCVIVLKKKRAAIGVDVLKKCWAQNTHGAGFMFADGQTLHIQKGFMTVEAFLRAWGQAWQEHSLYRRAAVIHFRIKTDGDVTPALCHPFEVRKGLALAHNGIMSELREYTSAAASDSLVFARDVAAHITSAGFASGAVWTVLEQFVRPGKMVFMDYRGMFRILNETGGTWKGRVWFSNTHWDNYTYTRKSWGTVTISNKPGKCEVCKSHTDNVHRYGWTMKYIELCQECYQKIPNERLDDMVWALRKGSITHRGYTVDKSSPWARQCSGCQAWFGVPSNCQIVWCPVCEKLHRVTKDGIVPAIATGRNEEEIDFIGGY